MNFKRIGAIFHNEFLFLRRDRLTFAVSLFLPIILLFILSYAVTNKVQKAPLGVMNEDGSPFSRSLLRKLEESGPFVLKEGRSKEEVLSWVKEGKVKAGLFFPSDFSLKLIKGDSAPLPIILEGFEPLATRSYMNGLDSAGELSFLGLKDDFYFLSSIKTPPGFLDLSFKTLFNPSLDHFAFIIPGLMGCILMALIPIMAGISVVREKESGSFNRILASPTSTFELLVGKLAAYFFLAMVDFGILASIGILFFHIPFRGNIFLFMLIASIFSLWTSAYGLLLSTFSENQLTAFTTSIALTLLPMLIFSGLYFPLQGIPLSLRWISYLIPIRYYVEISREIFLKGNSVLDWWPDLLGMTMVTLMTLGWMFYRFKKASEGPT